MNFSVEEGYDVNLTPNKREVFIRETVVFKILDEIKQFVEKNVV